MAKVQLSKEQKAARAVVRAWLRGGRRRSCTIDGAALDIWDTGRGMLCRVRGPGTGSGPPLFQYNEDFSRILSVSTLRGFPDALLPAAREAMQAFFAVTGLQSTLEGNEIEPPLPIPPEGGEHPNLGTPIAEPFGPMGMQVLRLEWRKP